MTPHQRLSELAALLAKGYLRPHSDRSGDDASRAADSGSGPLELHRMPDVDRSPRG